MTPKDNTFDSDCKRFFNDLSIDHQDFMIVYDPYPIARYYFVDSQDKDVVKITDKKMIELINYLYVSSISLEEEQWLLNKEKSGYTVFENFEERKQLEKEKQLLLDAEYNSIKI